jgi:hypothetical protein
MASCFNLRSPLAGPLRATALAAALAAALTGCAGQAEDVPEEDQGAALAHVPAAGQTAAQELVQASEVKQAEHHDASAPLRLLPLPPRSGVRMEHEVKRLPRRQHHAAGGTAGVTRQALTLLAPATLANFDGIGQGFAGPSGAFTVDSAPPDTNGDIGPNHYVQSVNSDFAIFSKTGTVLYGPAPLNTLWSGFGGDCQVNNDGDPVVLYDPIADRWVISQFSVTNANGGTKPFLQCVAVSQTPDPTGAWYRYSFSYTGFPDYPKMGVWPDGYYTSFNMFNAAGTSYTGAKVCAYDRAKMLTGAAATQQCFNTTSTYGGLLPADLDGARLPPAGAANLVLGLGATSTTLAYWKFHVDWTTPGSSTFTGPSTLAITSYAEACGTSGTCIPQSGGGSLDALSDRLMFRLAYRNFADGHQSLVVNHAITVSPSTGVRWYELRLDGAGTPTLYQQGTYAPDATYRWMGSIAQDQAGNMALGFSASSSSLKPSVRYTGRLAADALGQMTLGEGTLVTGGGAQGSAVTRWGDYSMMGVDPSDDCTFWFTSEYIPANGTFNWKTRIGSFKLPGCPAIAARDFSIGAAQTALSVSTGGTGTDAITTAVTNGSAETVTFSVSGLPTGANATFSPVSVTAGGGSTLTFSALNAALGTYTLTVTGTSPSAAHSATVTVTIVAGPDYTLSLSPSSGAVTGGASTTFSVTSGAIGGSTQSIALSAAGLPAGVTGVFTPGTITAGAGSTLTVSAVSTAAATTAAFTVKGTAGAVTHAAAGSLTVVGTTTTLTSGVPVPGLAGAAAAQTRFVIDVPAGQTSLTVTTSGGTGDVDLYVKAGAMPTTGVYDCRGYTTGNAENCTLNAPAAGQYYILLNGYGAYAGVTLTATVAGDALPLANGVATPGISGALNSAQYWKLSLPAGQAQVVFTISGGTGDADLYVQPGARPTTTAYACRPYLDGSAETCTLSAPAAGDWYVMLRGYTAFSGVTLTGRYQ